ncbi:MAG: hypothetical protein RIS45_1692, partial [Planctomycetota bacterium]
PEPGEDLAAERAAALRSKAIGRGYEAAVVDAVLRDEAAARGEVSPGSSGATSATDADANPDSAKPSKASRSRSGPKGMVRGKGSVGGWVPA